jgi:hypothetical protein
MKFGNPSEKFGGFLKYLNIYKNYVKSLNNPLDGLYYPFFRNYLSVCQILKKSQKNF